MTSPKILDSARRTHDLTGSVQKTMGEDENADECAEKTTGKASVGFGADVKGCGSSKVDVTSSLPTAVENFVKSTVSTLRSHTYYL